MSDKSRLPVVGPRYRFDLLSETHILDHFECEHTFLVLFLRNKAWEEVRQDLSRTYVLLDTDEPSEESVVGYFTLRADSISYTPIGGKLISIPVIEIACLARHIKRKGRDVWAIGPALLIEALRHIDSVSQQVGVSAVHLSYTDEGEVLYEVQGQRTFNATLYLSDTLGDVQMPIELVSKHRQRQKDEFHVVEKVIGSIVTITSCSTGR